MPIGTFFLLREALPDAKQQRVERFNDRMTEMRITRTLRQAAEVQKNAGNEF